MRKLLSLLLVAAFVGALVVAQEKNTPADKSEKPKTESVQKAGCCSADMAAKKENCKDKDCCKMKENAKGKECCMEKKSTTDAKASTAPKKK
jgi:hypothetical protein